AYITFPSGYSTEIVANSDGDLVEDATTPIAEKIVMKPHFPPQVGAPNDPKRVIIQVDIEPEESDS
ncbi:MAG: hypothetical protein SFZ02_19860, partial [bacterium]|nr:hypothetical protein [bacterium]